MTDRRQSRRPIPRGRIYSAAAIVPAFALGFLLLPRGEKLRAAGPANTGHEVLECAQCHTSAEGTARQQVQANVRFLLGMRDRGADFIHKPVGNVDCLACHQNNEDKHPVYRFNEPRFAEVRAELAPQNCVSCHTEHTGKRVTSEPTVCASCHTGLEIKEDPIEPTHAALEAREEWSSCLSCHDFHGNHVQTTPVKLEDGASAEAVLRYLAGGPAIYGDSVKFPAKTERTDR